MASTCPHCGYNLPERQRKASKASASVRDPCWRLPGNGRPHVEISRTLDEREALAGSLVKAAKARRETMLACPCRLCSLWLDPGDPGDPAWRNGISIADQIALGIDLDTGAPVDAFKRRSEP